MKSQLVFIGLFLILSVTACTKRAHKPIDLKHDYFNLVEGAFAEYDVTYMFHDEALLKHDTIQYQLKTVIGDTVIDNSGRIARKFNRYVRETMFDPWILKDVWTIILEDNRAELVEENQRKVKLVFAPTRDKKWDVNMFNLEGEVSAVYDSIDAPKTIQGITYENTLIAREKKYTTLIDNINKYEVYARGVGMIYKMDKSLKFNFAQIIPKEGTEYYYRIYNYGIE